jgi:FkbH-like protein
MSSQRSGVPLEISREEIVCTRWVFGPRGGQSLTDSFRFGQAGRIEDYLHDNEDTWRLAGGSLEIYRRNGQLMWTSERAFRDGEGRRCITLKAAVDPSTEFVLAERKAPLSSGDFLFPKDLQVTPTQLERVLLVGSCLSELYQKQFSQRFRGVTFERVLFNFAGDLPETPPSPVADYDLQYVQLPVRSILSDRIIWAARFNEPGFAQEILTDARNLIDVMLGSAMAYNQRYGLLSLVSNFFVPQMSAATSLRTRHNIADLPYLVRRLNDYLAEAVDKYKNAYLVDVNAIADSIGKQYVLDDMIYFYSHGAVQVQPDAGSAYSRIEPIPPIAEFYESKRDTFIEAVYDQMVATYRTVHQIDQVKAVIFDLDHTLWRGQLAEHYRPDGSSWPPADGWPMGIWEAIQHLRARGILVAICSKNDENTVREWWANAVRPEFVSLSDFASIKISWRAKAENVRAICEEFNIKPKSVVFIDDNPVERAAVKAAFPDIRVIGSNPYLTRRILLWAPETQVAALTDESMRREEMVRGQIVREETRTTMTREQFLGTLKCSVRFTQITSTGHPEFGRALELINKTNQFNTTGIRWTHRQINEFLGSGGQVLSFNVTDRFADYGLVGVLLSRGASIVQFVMSCRVLGLEVEIAALAFVISSMQCEDGGNISASLKETPDNMPCREVYKRAGFTQVKSSAEGLEFSLQARQNISVPGHVTIVGSSIANAQELAGLPVGG